MREEAGELAGEGVVIVWSSFPVEGRVGEVAELLVKERLAACVHIFPAGESVYEWEGKLQRDGERVVMIKTRAPCVAGLMRRLRELHPYSVPEILVQGVESGWPPYLEWVGSSVVGG